MLKSMTGFGSSERDIASLGKVCVEMRSSNHKFLEIVLHLPEGFLSLEEKMRKEMEPKIKRGRVTCAVNITNTKQNSVFINRNLVKSYLSAVGALKKQLRIPDKLGLDTLLHLPGVLSLVERKIPKQRIWPALKILIHQALEDLVATRQKEGRVLSRHLKNRAQAIRAGLDTVGIRFKKAIKDKLAQINTDEERASFLKETDISEELERLTFHIHNFKNKLSQSEPVGKELDFIAQEMQREANTIAAKSFDAHISTRVVQIKSQIEKIREQVQNIE